MTCPGSSVTVGQSVGADEGVWELVAIVGEADQACSGGWVVPSEPSGERGTTVFCTGDRVGTGVGATLAEVPISSTKAAKS